MKKFDKGTIFILVILITVGAVSWFLYFKQYLQKDTVDIAAFPEKIGPWIGETLPLEKVDYEILETHNVFVRRYKTTQP